ncbi:flavin reductase [Gulosibacter macacae]|uniref:Flavin reductase n=1 Tax=Gulosibacter macacae TaxID=2488791 RepID=A0A3P3VUR3_9MICO|nr:flavin reductase family protein [Gulosibacter macacae]RRJ86194.1 flavin reductase [Gulosibacter macacae]
MTLIDTLVRNLEGNGNVTERTHATPLNDAEFRNIIGHFASGVTVVSTSFDGQLYGTTASAFSSLSLDPISVLVCLNATSSTNPAITGSGYFAINILSEDQADVARHFGRRGGDKFADVDYRISDFGGVPVLDRALATIVCEVMDAPVGGTHTVYFGRVLEAAVGGGEPLAYYRGKFGRFAQFDES